MKAVIDFILTLIFSAGFLFGNGLAIKKIHDFVKKEAIEQFSKGLSSSEEMANRLTKQKLPY